MDPVKPPVDDAPSAAELEFIERIRNDRARGRTLRRRATLGTTMMLVVVAVFLATRGVPPSPVDPGAGPSEAPAPWLPVVDVPPPSESVAQPSRNERRLTRVAQKVARPPVVRSSGRQIALRDGRIKGSAGHVRIGWVAEAP
jgi:hypothetical protein